MRLTNHREIHQLIKPQLYVICDRARIPILLYELAIAWKSLGERLTGFILKWRLASARSHTVGLTKRVKISYAGRSP